MIIITPMRRSPMAVVSSLRLLREAVHGLMEGVPYGTDLPEVGRALASVPGVASVHDLHIWAVKSDLPVLTAHLIVRDLADWEGVLERSHAMVRERFGITHVTLQPEPMERRIHWRDRPEHPPRDASGSSAEGDRRALFDSAHRDCQGPAGADVSPPLRPVKPPSN